MKKKCGFRPIWKQVPWISEELREMMKIRNHLWKKAKKTKDEHVWIEFRRVRNFVTSEVRHCKREYLGGVIHQALDRDGTVFPC